MDKQYYSHYSKDCIGPTDLKYFSSSNGYSMQRIATAFMNCDGEFSQTGGQSSWEEERCVFQDTDWNCWYSKELWKANGGDVRDIQFFLPWSKTYWKMAQEITVLSSSALGLKEDWRPLVCYSILREVFEGSFAAAFRWDGSPRLLRWLLPFLFISVQCRQLYK